jgi:c-di-GMP-binding flagellar brake protein YcgR
MMESCQDRRRFPRIRVYGSIAGRVEPLDDVLVVHDISLGGFAVESPLGFMAGSDHRFEFALPTGERLRLSATDVHCVRLNVAGSSPHYFAGFAFDRVRGKDQRAIRDFVGAALRAVA